MIKLPELTDEEYFVLWCALEVEADSAYEHGPNWEYLIVSLFNKLPKITTNYESVINKDLTLGED